MSKLSLALCLVGGAALGCTASEFPCSSEGTCPDGLSCERDGLCRVSDGRTEGEGEEGEGEEGEGEEGEGEDGEGEDGEGEDGEGEDGEGEDGEGEGAEGEGESGGDLVDVDLPEGPFAATQFAVALSPDALVGIAAGQIFYAGTAGPFFEVGVASPGLASPLQRLVLGGGVVVVTALRPNLDGVSVVGSAFSATGFPATLGDNCPLNDADSTGAFSAVVFGAGAGCAVSRATLDGDRHLDVGGIPFITNGATSVAGFTVDLGEDLAVAFPAPASSATVFKSIAVGSAGSFRTGQPVVGQAFQLDCFHVVDASADGIVVGEVIDDAGCAWNGTRVNADIGDGFVGDVKSASAPRFIGRDADHTRVSHVVAINDGVLLAGSFTGGACDAGVFVERRRADLGVVWRHDLCNDDGTEPAVLALVAGRREVIVTAAPITARGFSGHVALALDDAGTQTDIGDVDVSDLRAGLSALSVRVVEDCAAGPVCVEAIGR